MKNKTLYLLFSLVLMCWVMTFTGCASAPAPHVSEADFDNDVWSSVWPDNSDLEEGAMGVRISELSAFSGTVADADELIFNDYSETPSTRRITAANLFAYPANATQAELAGFAANPLSIPEFDNVQWASFIDITDLESADLIDFTKDADKPVSTAQYAALSTKAPASGIKLNGVDGQVVFYDYDTDFTGPWSIVLKIRTGASNSTGQLIYLSLIHI